MVETRDGLDRLEEIAATPGLDGIYIGPADLALALGLTPGAGGDVFDDAIAHVRETCDAHGLIAGMHCHEGKAAQAYAAQGFKLLTVGVDSSLLKAAISNELAQARAAGGEAELVADGDSML
jgi:4-hydroxy-2-oxoheptanedioate aldolase